jgi:hypothetical protein
LGIEGVDFLIFGMDYLAEKCELVVMFGIIGIDVLLEGAEYV